MIDDSFRFTYLHMSTHVHKAVLKECILNASQVGKHNIVCMFIVTLCIKSIGNWGAVSASYGSLP